MKYLLIFLSLFLSTLSYADDSSAQAQAMKAAFQHFVQLDRQIEGLLQEKLETKAEAAQHLERASTGILPGRDRRQARQAENAMQKVQDLSSQIEKLDQERQAVLASLK